MNPIQIPYAMAPKRSGPPLFVDLHDRKRARSGRSAVGRPPPATYLTAASLSDEIFLCIFSCLDWSSLSAVERVDKHFMRLANDPLLWKSLYLGLHIRSTADVRSHPQHRSSASTERLIAPLPLRGQRVQEEQPVDWKHLYRVRTNFSNGRSRLTSLPGTPTRPPLEAKASVTSLCDLPAGTSSCAPKRSTLLVLVAPFLITISTDSTSSVPQGRIFRVKNDSRQATTLLAGEEVATFASAGLANERAQGWLKGPIGATDVVLDGLGWTPYESDRQSTTFYLSYSSGAFSIFTIILASDSSVPRIHERHFQPSPPVPPLHPAVTSTLYDTLLVTCTDRFRLSFYFLPKLPSGKPTVLRPFRSLRSMTAWQPATLRLAPSSSSYSTGNASSPSLKLSIAYAVPVYPDLFSVALQEIHLSPSSTTALYDWTSDRSLSALAQNAFVDAPAKGGGAVGTVRDVSAIALDEDWVCLAGRDNVVQVFRIPPAGEGDGRGRTLEWTQTLWAHGAAVTSVSCVQGRCVTADATGRLLIWELDRDLPAREPSTRLRPPPSPSGGSVSISAVVRPSSVTASTSARWVEVLTPRIASPPPRGSPTDSLAFDADDEHLTGRGREIVEYVCQDDERIVSVGVPKLGGGSNVKVWAFDH